MKPITDSPRDTVSSDANIVIKTMCTPPSKYAIGAERDVMTPKTARRKPRENLELKYARVTRDDPELYEEKIEWIADQQRIDFQKMHRGADRQAWEIFLETKMDTLMHIRTEKRSKDIDEAKRRKRVEREKIEREKKEMLDAKRAEIQMKTLNKERLKRARQLFYGASTRANFSAWKDYTAYIISKRAEDRKKCIRRLKWSFAVLLLMVGLAYGAYVLTITIQEEQRLKKAQAAQELADAEERRSRNKAENPDKKRLRRHLKVLVRV